MRNGLFYVAKEDGSDQVLGISMWLRPRPLDQPQSWHDWFEDWRLWFDQLKTNVWYGRGGLNVKVGIVSALPSSHVGIEVLGPHEARCQAGTLTDMVCSVTTYGSTAKRRYTRTCGRIPEATTS